MILCRQFLLEDFCSSSLWLEGFAAWISRVRLRFSGSGSGSRGQSLARVIVGLGCCSRPWSAIPVAASVASASADRGYWSSVVPLIFRWVSRGGCLRCLVAGASTGSGSSVCRLGAVPLSSTVTSLFRWCLCICRW
ncbi:hypothetical protein DY000_02053983 [Brassica cretica]|uniref:Uncharacterized protein n=1 Tax=Brassica cretica TaxID=69181 RepID=A0ABQ7AMC0_BRACR|nr:hypothetical protein DY000_02053983 [Brassica cretica]